ncbi:MAG TPA: Xaa-Pro peptidase family protein [Frateuria sp.]|uniref:M24 family metallopeptidase n=1 Tax=Frateuria sp. TaxID=2211372 RepID=UPI002DEB44F4|nr:Xaa-Pro peptidase family protein [Frateuria sp.]
MDNCPDTASPGRRRFLQSTALGVAALPAAMLGATASAKDAAADAIKLPPSILALQPVASQVVPITDAERRARLARAQELMGRFRMDAIYLDGGTTLDYYTGMRWWTSERLMGMVLPRSGDPVYVTPAFERSRALEQIRFGHDVRTWQENESPYALVAQVMRERHAGTGVLGIEEKVPFFRATGLAEAMPQVKLVPATPVTAGCRAIKSPAELALMQVACNATLALYKAIWQGLEPGMTQQYIAAWVEAGYARMGLRGDASINVGEFTAQPHGSREPQVIREGTPVMLDDGCYVEGYMSDLTRTFTLGKASDKMKRVFDIVRKAQRAALTAAHPGATMESVDAAARKVITDAGYGPGYTYFSHRLGHGIGMDMHEWYYLVQGNTRRIEPGMTFSDEPGIYIPGEFGVRLEDDMHVGADGARWFTPQSPSIEQPFG